MQNKMRIKDIANEINELPLIFYKITSRLPIQFEFACNTDFSPVSVFRNNLLLNQISKEYVLIK